MKRIETDFVNGVGSSSSYFADGTPKGTTIFDSSFYAGNTTGGESGSTWTYFQDNTDTLLGRVLTIIDATYADSAQRDAVKSLVKDAFYRYRTPQNWTVTSGCTGTGTSEVWLKS